MATVLVSKELGEVLLAESTIPSARVSKFLGEVLLTESTIPSVLVSKALGEVLLSESTIPSVQVSKLLGEALFIDDSTPEEPDTTNRWLYSQRHIWNFLFQTKAEAQAAGRSSELCFVFETMTGYALVIEGAGYTINGTSVLGTGLEGNTRWVGVFGQYNYFLESSSA